MIPRQWTTLSSSNIKAIMQDEDGLNIEFQSGAIYHYAGVPDETAQGLLHASSPGRYFQNFIKDDYTGERTA